MNVALLTAYKKDAALEGFARALVERGWELLASAGTKKHLDGCAVESTDVSSIVGQPILGHRVVTLSREIHAGLLARSEDQAELERLGIRRIDLVYVDLYPLEDEMRKSDATQESLIDKTDIGGPTLLRAAAKGRRIVLSSPAQFAAALAYIDSGAVNKKYLAGLAAEAERVAAAYAESSAEACARFA